MNPKAGAAEANAALLEHLASRPDVEVLKSDSNEDLLRLVREAATGGKYRFVAVAGGDGTVHAAVNALAPQFPRTPLAIIPLGTGNDLCRSLDVPLDPGAAVKLLDRPRVKRID